MKVLILLFCSLFSCSFYCHAQSKKEYIYDENGRTATLDVFKQKAKWNNMTYTLIEDDSTVTARLHLIEEIGDLSPDIKQAVVKELERLAGKAIDTSKTIVINYYFEQKKGEKDCIHHLLDDRTYRRYFRNSKSDLEFSITEKGHSVKDERVYEDTHEAIRKLLFPHVVHCGNYIIIRPNGHFLRRLSEHRQDQIPDKVKGDW